MPLPSAFNEYEKPLYPRLRIRSDHTMSPAARDQTYQHSPQWANPMVVDGQLEKPGHADQHRQNANPV